MATLTRIILIVFKLIWRILRVVLYLLTIALRLSIRWAWRRTVLRSMVYVRRDWNDPGVGRVRWSNLRNPGWDTVSGGNQVENPLPLLHAYVWCDRVRGKIGHSCSHGPGPHNIKVCMLREDNSRVIWRRLLNLAGPDRRLESG